MSERGRMLSFIPLMPWQVEYMSHLYPDDFKPRAAIHRNVGLMVLGDNRRLIYETDWDSPEAKTWERVWEEAERKAK